MLGLLVNPLTTDDKYSLLNRGNLLQHFQMQLSEKRKYFMNFFLNFPNLDSVLNIFKTNMMLLADVYLKLRTPEKVVRQMSKESHSRGLFNNQHCRLAETQLKSKRKHLYHNYWTLWAQFSCKKSLWVICNILGLFVNPLSADDKYSLVNRDNLFQNLERQLSRERETFCPFFVAFSKYRLNFEHFQKKSWPS